MKAVHKLILLEPDHYRVRTHVGAKVLTVGPQNGHPCVWVEVDTEAPTTLREFSIFGTGHSIPHGAGTYAGTLFDGRFVWHIYDAGEK